MDSKNSISIIDYCKLNNIRYFDINIKIKASIKTIDGVNYVKNKKIPLPFENYKLPTITDLKADEKIYNSIPKDTDSNYIWIDTRDFNHLDVDHEQWNTYCDESKNIIDDYKNRLPYFKSKTKKLGIHFIFKTENDEFSTLNKPETKFKDIEILVGCGSWISKDTEIINYDKDNILKTDELETFFNDGIIPTKQKINIQDKEDEEQENKTDEKNRELIRIVNNIDIKYCDDYDHWTKIIWGLRNHSKDNKGLAKHFSKKSDKYDEDAFLKIWRNTRSGNNIATVYYYSKKSNEENFKKIKAEFMKVDQNIGTDDYLAKLFLKDNGLNYVYKDDILYTYHKKIWSVDKHNNKLKCYLSPYLYDILNCKLFEVNRERGQASIDGDDSKIKHLSSLVKFLNETMKLILSTNKINNVTSRIIHLLSCEDFKNIRFDENPNIYCFNNKCYDLKLLDWIKPRREDYILTTTNYDYEETGIDHLNKLTDLINKILPCEQVRKTYINYMATSLFGIAIEKFIIANGGGGNGKGVANELLVECLGNYAYTAPNEILLQPIKSGNNPAVSNMHNKRLVIYREPDSENQKLCGSAIKELTGGSEIAARMNYSNDMKTQLKATHILECNKKLKIDGRIDDSYLRRLVDVPFKSTFTNNQELLDQGLDNIYKSNTYFKSTEFKKEYKCTLFDYLVNHIKQSNGNVCENLYECREIKDRTRDYLQDSDDLYAVINESLEKTKDKSDYITIKDIFQIYKSSDYYLNLSKKQKREQNYKWLINEISSNVNFRSYYKDRAKINGKSIFTCLVCYKLKQQEEEFIEDELD